MNLLDAVCRVLEQAGEELHYRDITDRVIGQGRWNTQSRDPYSQLDSYLSAHIRSGAKDARIKRVEWGIYGLNSGVPKISEQLALTQKQVPSNPSTQLSESHLFVIAAIKVLQKYSSHSPLHYTEITTLAMSLGYIPSGSASAAHKMLIYLQLHAKSANRISPKPPEALRIKIKHLSDGRFVLKRRQRKGTQSNSSNSEIANPKTTRSSPVRRQRKAGSLKAKKIRKKKSPMRVTVSFMSYSDAASHVLQIFGKPMRYQEVAAEIDRVGFLVFPVADPEKQLVVELYREMSEGTRHGTTNRFIIYGDDFIGLTAWTDARINPS